MKYFLIGCLSLITFPIWFMIGLLFYIIYSIVSIGEDINKFSKKESAQNVRKT